MISSLALGALAASLASIAAAQGPDGNPWTGVGSASFYWHNRYHGLLAMAAYGDYENLCPQTFTYESLQHQYPGNTNQPFQVVGKWGPTPKYKSEGYMVRVPEMNKILAVFKGQYGWQQYPAYLSPFNGVGCDGRCMAHTGALEAWKEVQEETNDFQAIKSAQGNLVWSISGHGFGGMIAQVAALDLKSRGLAYSIHTFGSPAVFNQASVNRWNDLFHGDDSQRTVANEDSIPTAIGQGYNVTSGLTANYTFVNTGIHVFGQSSMYGQDFYVCVDAPTDPRCHGGNVEADHYFYYTEIGTCGRGWGASYDPSENGKSLWEAQQAFNATHNGTHLPFNPSTEPPAPPAPTTTSSSVLPTATAINLTDASVLPTSTGAPGVAGNAAASAGTENVAAGSAGVGTKVSGMAMVLAGLAVLFA